MQKILAILLLAFCSHAASVRADEPVSPLQSLRVSPQPEPSVSLFDRTLGGVQKTIDEALELLGVRYRRGGTTPESGFDCSGFVRHVYNEALGLVLPHNAKAISQQGERVEKQELQPGDLVFFNTMRKAFSHVGIYLGNNQFVHAPRPGARVRIEDMTENYWSRRYNGARRVQP